MNQLNKILLKSINFLFIIIFIFLSFFSFSFAQSYSDSSTAPTDPNSSSINAPSNSSSYDSGYIIKSLNTFTQISNTGIKVTEKFDVNFNTLHHGIFRYIPQIYEYHSEDLKVNTISRLKISGVTVTDENQKPLSYTDNIEKNSILNKTDLISGIFYDVNVIKTGDPNVLIQGNHSYVINYTITNLPEINQTFLYNVLGSGWSTDIMQFNAEVKFDSPPLDFNCYTGFSDQKVLSSSNNQCLFKKISDTDYTFSAVNVGYKSGVLITTKNQNFNHNTSDFIVFISYYWYLIIPFISIFLLFLYWILTQRAPKGSGVITPQFTISNDFRPAEVGTLFDDSVDKIDVSATFIDLAIRGYIKIKNISNTPKNPEFQIFLLKPVDNNLRPYEITLLNGLFNQNFNSENYSSTNNTLQSINVSELAQGTMVNIYNQIQSQIYLSEIQKGYYKSIPEKSNALIFALIFGVVLAFPAVIFQLTSIIVALIIGLITFIISLPFFYFRNYKTLQGVLAKEKIEGLKLFIQYAKEDQLKMMQTPSQEIYEKYLPYAMVFGLHESWSKVFKDINISNPGWYDSGIDNTFWNIIFFSTYLNLFSNSMNTVFSIPVSDTGGGLIGGIVGDAIGGGFSGGGGGSW